MPSKGRYEPTYTKAESRALYIIAIKEYSSVSQMAMDWGVSRQAIGDMLSKKLPTKYASYLARKYKFPAGILCYKDYLLMTNIPVEYPELFKKTGYFIQEDIAWILEGQYEKSSEAVFAENDNSITFR